MSIYPTLTELCQVKKPDHLEGESLLPLLKDPEAAWNRPAITTHGRGNHAVRDSRWRLIHYANGDRELYDHQSDPQEWKNLAADSTHAKTIARLAKWLPQSEAPDAAFDADLKRGNAKSGNSGKSGKNRQKRQQPSNR
jgi:arylsulfatase A-like enzyme